MEANMKSNREISHRLFEEVWNRKKLSVLSELVTSDYAHHDAQSPAVQRGVEAYTELVRLYLNAFPDLRFTIQDEIEAGDKLVTRWKVDATQDGDLPGIRRTGRRVALTGITIAQFRNGKMAESWNNWDALIMMQQLGAASASAA
jgi:steroid delta-isomerase-like uncharacterized protein